MSVLFISHSSADAEAAAELKRWLGARGHGSLFLDFDPESGIPAGRDWERELYLQLKSCRALIVLCSERSMASKWCFAELAIARSLGKPIFPLLVEPCEVPGHLGDVQIVDLREDGDGTALDRLAQGLAAAGIEAAPGSAWDRGRSPYPGLLAFDEPDGAIFFGRDREIGETIERLNRARRFGETALVLVLGASGSGKSSLVRAGVVPRLRIDEQRWLVVEPFRPRDDPLAEMAAAVARTGERSGREVDWRPLRDRLARSLDADPTSTEALDEILRDLRLDSGRRLARPLLILDQFEELLGHPPTHPAHRFLRLLRAAVARPDPPLLVLGTMRSDFLAAFQTDPALGGLAFAGQSLGPMPVESLVQVIERPAELVGLEIEQGLVQALLREVDTDDALPLLAFTLAELYQGRGRDGAVTVRAYRDELGGLRGSVARAARRVLAARHWDAADLDRLRAAFLALARLDREGRFSRRSASWKEIGRRVGGLERARALLDPFVEARLLVSRGGDDGAGTVEVAHEALFRSWGRLSGWLDRHRDDLRLEREVAEAAEIWEREDRGEELLWRGGRLERAQELNEGGRLAQGDRELEFVRAGVSAERRRRRRRRTIVQAVVVLALAVAAVTSWLAWREARARHLADRQVSRYLARQAEDQLAGRLDLALLLGVEAYRTAPTFAATSVLLSALESKPRLEAFLPGDGETVRAVAFAPDGRRVAFGGYGQTLRLWDVPGRRPVCAVRLDGLKNWIEGVAFAPDGGIVVTAGDDGVLRLWSAGDCSPLGELGRHRGKVAALAVSAEGTVVSGGEEDRSVRVWRLDGGAAVDLGEQPSAVLGVAVSADGRRVVAGGLDGGLRLWDLPASTARLLGRHPQAVAALAFSPDGRWVASGSADEGGVAFWPVAPDPATEAPPAAGPEGPVSALAFSADGALIASGSPTGEIRVWSVGDPRRAIEIADAGGPVLALDLDPDDPTRLVAAHGAKGSVRLWDVGLPGDPGRRGLTWPGAVAFAPDGNRLAVVDDGTLRFLDPATGEPRGQPFPASAAREEVGDVAFSADGRYLATGGDDGTVRLWDPVTRQQWALPGGHEAAVRSVAFSADGKRIAAGGEDSTVRVWSVDERTLLHVLAHDDWVNAVAFGPEAGLLASGGDDGTVRIWNASTGEPRGPTKRPDDGAAAAAVVDLAVEPAGGLVAAVGDDGSVWIWNRDGEPATDAPLRTDGPASAVAFSGDGRTLAVGDLSGTLRLWRVETHSAPGAAAVRLTPLATVAGDDAISALAFRPRAALLAVVRSHTVELLDLSGIDAWTARACGRANRDLTREEWSAFIGPDVPYEPTCDAPLPPAAVAAFFRSRFGPRAELLSALVLVPSYFGWIAAQLVALAGLLELILGLDPALGILLSAAVAISYTLLGGMWSVTSPASSSPRCRR